MNKYIALLIPSILFWNVNKSVAQETNLKKEVQVVKPYEPSISDAYKINLQPKIEDTIKVNPNFNYSIIQRPINTYFQPNPISAARMLPEPLKDLQRGLIKIGIGNRSLPLFEAYYTSPRNKEFSYGAWVNTNNNIGKVKLADNSKVDAQSNVTNMGLQGKRMFADKILSGNITYNRNHYLYYGYDTDNATVTPTSDKQTTNNLNANLGFQSTYKDSSRLNYFINTNFGHLSDKYDMQETKIKGYGGVNKYLKNEQFGSEISLTQYLRNNQFFLQNNTIFTLSPWIKFFGKQWRVQAGVNITYDANDVTNNTYFFPKAHFSYDIVSNYIVPYVELNGYLTENSYSELLRTNPWLNPGSNGWNTANKLILTGGIKGKFSAKITYDVQASYSIIDSMAFFQNISIDATNPLLNRFGLVFDNMEQTKIQGELSIAPSRKVNMLFHAEYFSYKTETLEHPWNLPDYTAFFRINYNLFGRIFANANVFMVGNRWVQGINGNAPKKLSSYADINLGLDYSYNGRLFVFLNLNNLTSSNYQQWYLYPVQGFNIQIGASYRL